MKTLRALKVLGLLVVAALAALLSGGPAGAGDTTGAVMAVVAEAVPAPLVSALPGGDALAASGTGGAGPTAAPATTDTTTTTTTATTTTPTAAATTTTTTAATATTTTAATSKPTPSRTAEAERPARGRAEGTPCRAGARACVDLSANQAWLINDGEASYGPVPITHGRRGYRTPPGTFAVSFKNRDHVSSIYDAPMPYSVFFNGGIAFHQGSLNQRSHGCIHLSRSAAKRFFANLSPGDTVQVVR